MKIGFGTDFGATLQPVPGFAEHRELQFVVEAGLTPSQTLTIATRDAAAMLGLSDGGLLAAGKSADLINLDADPTESVSNTTQIFAVWHRGKWVGDLPKSSHHRASDA